MPAAAARSGAAALGDEVAGDQGHERGRQRDAHRREQVHAPRDLAERQARPEPADRSRRPGSRSGGRSTASAAPSAPRRCPRTRSTAAWCAGRSRTRAAPRPAATKATALSLYGIHARGTRPVSGAVRRPMYTHRHLGARNDAAHPPGAPNLMARGPVGRTGRGGISTRSGGSMPARSSRRSSSSASRCASSSPASTCR